MSDKILQWITAVICAVLSYMYGEFDGMLKALIFCMAIDYITGLIANYNRGIINET